MQERRKAKRDACELLATLETNIGRMTCQIRNISTIGLLASIDSPASLAVGQTVSVSQTELGRVNGTVRWTSTGEFGMAFSQPIPTSTLSAAIQR
ncbi:MAG: hypothetical protein GKR97_20485 [Rhizobiaceae bacterium]|nr:hypothetical protein [Rhizobiaceae bacterium]